MEREIQQPEYSFESDEAIPCKIKDDWDQAGRKGQYFGFMYFLDKKWAVVLWDDESDPDFFKAEGIEVARTKWVGIEYD